LSPVNWATIINRDLPFNIIIGSYALNTVNNTKSGASTSRFLATNIADTPIRKAAKHANSPKIQHFGILSTRTNPQFLPGGADSR